MRGWPRRDASADRGSVACEPLERSGYAVGRARLDRDPTACKARSLVVILSNPSGWSEPKANLSSLDVWLAQASEDTVIVPVLYGGGSGLGKRPEFTRVAHLQNIVFDREKPDATLEELRRCVRLQIGRRRSRSHLAHHAGAGTDARCRLANTAAVRPSQAQNFSYLPHR